MTFRSARARLRTAMTAGLTAALALTLTACTLPADPSVTRESIQEITAAPNESAADASAAEPVAPEPLEPLELEPLECLPYLVVTARGTGEPTRGQLLSPVARAIKQARPGKVVVADLDYPADTDVNAGGTAGVHTLVTRLNQQAETCPDQKFVLLGYSQGAMVIGDALVAPIDRMVGEAAAEINPQAAAAISAIVFYGDPRFVGAATYNEGSYDEHRDGLLPRPGDALEAFGDRLRDYCVATDFICQATTVDLDESGHVEYFNNGMQKIGAAFAITKLGPLTKEEQAKIKRQSGDTIEKTKPTDEKSDEEFDENGGTTPAG